MFNEAWDHPDPKSLRKWQEAIQEEFNDIKNNVGRKILMSLMPPNVSVRKTNWCFKLSTMVCTRHD